MFIAKPPYRDTATEWRLVVTLYNKLLFPKEKKLDGPESFRHGGVPRCADFL